MAFRIRQRGGELEVEVDSAEEVRLLLQAVRRGGGQAFPLLSAPPAAAPIEPPAPQRLVRRGRPKAKPPAVSRRAALRSRVVVNDQELLAALERGPQPTLAIARRLKLPRHKVGAALGALAAAGRAHATGATSSLRWHLGPATSQALAAPRRSL